MPELKLNQSQVNQTCKALLEKAGQKPEPNHLYALQLALWTIEQGQLGGPWRHDQAAMKEQLQLLENSETAMSVLKADWVEGNVPVVPSPQDDPEEAGLLLLENLWLAMQEARNNMSIHTTLKIFNLLGQEVRTLVDEVKEPGHYTLIWDGRDGYGNNVASGVYFYRLTAENFTATKRMMLMK